MTVESTKTALNVLFLSADTGGGHRASAESLAKQFQLKYPGSTYTLLNVLADAQIYSNMEQQYKTFSAHPAQWKALYYITNTPAIDFVTTVQMKISEEPKIREKIKSCHPDVVVSVHPLMNNVPLISCRKISEETGKPLPFFTVVTDLGSGHSQWFSNQVEKIFVASEQIKTIAKVRGKVPDEKFVDAGLPIRHDFAVEAAKLGNRMSDDERKTLLVMGGGEGVGSLSDMVNALYAESVYQGIDANILVVCGRNEKLKQELEMRDWTFVMHKYYDKKSRGGHNALLLSPICFDKTNPLTASSAGCFDGSVTKNIKRILSNNSITRDNAVSPIEYRFQTASPLHTKLPEEGVEEEAAAEAAEAIEAIEAIEEKAAAEEGTTMLPDVDAYEHEEKLGFEDESHVNELNKRMTGNVTVYGLGFVTNMAEYMVASDVLVTKAGPGTIAEAASLSLPVMLTNFLPGQEEGNVDFVVHGGFGTYVSDANPSLAAEEVASWLLDDDKLKELSDNAKAHGKPHAAADIVRFIGDTTIEWHDKHQAELAENTVDTHSNTKVAIPSV